MRNRDLHDALRAFALEAAAMLREDQIAGAEVEFELEEGIRRRGAGPALYNYRPLTAQFLDKRWYRLRALPSAASAMAALGEGASAYLRVNGLRGGEAEPALRAMLERLYEDAVDMSFPEDRFERVYAEVEQTLYDGRRPATVVAPIYGLVSWPDVVELDDGISLHRGNSFDAPEEAAWGSPAAGHGDIDAREPNTLIVLTRELASDAPFPMDEARERFLEVIAALRLWKTGAIALGSIGWHRAGDGVWQAFELGGGELPWGERWDLADDEVEGLRGFVRALEVARGGGAVEWARSRFEMGCARARVTEALSDHLMGLRALVGTGASTSESDLALRVAVLCAEEGERRQVQHRIELAQALERFVMGHGVDGAHADAVGQDSHHALVAEVERHLRALLRDVLCGYLDPDLRAISNDLLLEMPPVPDSAHQAAPSEPAPAAGGDMTVEIEALEAAGGGIGVAAGEPGVQGELDWDDSSSYSAPV